MKNLKNLLRNELTKIQGGFNPSGSYVCCWDNNPSICSEPVNHDHGSDPGTLSCTKGSHLEPVKNSFSESIAP